MKNSIKNLWKITIFGVVFVIVILLWIFVIGISSNQPGSFFNKGHNAVWLGHEWIDEIKEYPDIEKLVTNLLSHQIDTVFVHVGPILSDGTIDPRAYQGANILLERIHKYDDTIKYQAWLGQVRNKLDLTDAKVRHNIANTCLILTQMVAFNGVHFDIEPVYNDDNDFILLLEEVRKILPEGRIMSVALAEFIPENFMWFFGNIIDFKNANSETIYKNTAKYADQIVVMVYDTGINSAWLYKWLVQEQTIRVTNLFKNKEVFIAIPAYDDKNDDFNPEAENLKNGLLGIIKGLNNFRSDEENFAGAAIYPYWKIDNEEWIIYDKLWLK